MPVLVASDAETGERKEVTVLLADLAGSLAIADALDPEDTHEVMNGFFELALEAVHAEGGTVNQFRGDGFMALFGAPRALGDDAARAMRAALQIRSRVREYGDSVQARFGLAFELRMGINTGVVWVGAIGSALRKDYTAEGATVGIAARLEAEASPGQVLVGHETVRRCGERFDLRYLGPRTVRGLSGATSVFELVGMSAARSRMEVERLKGLTPYVARVPEMIQLETLAAPKPGLSFVEVRGESGIGKSRLLLEYRAQLPDSVAKLTAQCREADARRAYMPWLEIVRGQRCAAKDDDERRRLEQLERQLEAGSAPEIEAGIAELLNHLGGRGGAVVALEDAQWLDPSSRRVLRSLEGATHAPVVVLATLRDGGDSDWAPRGSVARIDLGPLSEDARRALARAVLGPSPDADALVELAALRGGGNPLFVEEVARSLCHGDEPLRRAARLEISLRKAARVPDTLQAVVAARVDGLPEGSKRWLEAAAVIGREFDLALLSATALRTADASTELGVLCERGLLRETPHGRFEFSHGIVREVAYGQLVRERRAALHSRIATALEAREVGSSPDGASRIGAHFDAAGNGERAVEFLASAGRHYARVDAYAEAASHLSRVLELLRARTERDLVAETSIALSLAGCLNALDHSSEAAAVLECVDESASGDEDRRALAAAAIQNGWVRFMHENDMDGATRLIERGINLARELEGAERLLGMGHAYLARILNLDGKLDAAIKHSKRVVDLAAGRADAAGKVMALYNLALTLCDSGQLSSAREAALEAQDLARAGESDLLKGMAQVALAKSLLFDGDVAAALAAASRGCSAAEAARQRGLLHSGVTLSGYAWLLEQAPTKAHAMFERLAEIDNAQWPATALHRARGFLEIGSYDEAARLARNCLELSPPRMLRARSLSVLGLAVGLSDADRREDAEAALEESMSICETLRLEPYLAETHRFMAELLEERGEVDRAAHFRERAEEGFSRCSMMAHAAEAARLPLAAGTAVPGMKISVVGR